MMLNSPILAQTAERWCAVPDFDGYSISDHGRVLNERKKLYMTINQNPRGIAIVGLNKNGTQHKRSVSVMVAQAFVHRPSENFNTPVNLDGDRSNNHYANLVWRPLWFARKYGLQFNDNHDTFDEPIEDVETRIVYNNSMEAAVTHGLLDYEIYLSMLNNTYVWPSRQIFRKAN